MIRITQADGFAEKVVFGQLKSRSGEVNRQVTAAVNEVLYQVKLDGDDAVREYTRRFDGVEPVQFVLDKQDMDAALRSRSTDFVWALRKAAENIRNFHEKQKQNSWFQTMENGAMVGQRVRGLARVGIYVPGGTAAYPSSVLMNAIPAKIAGVREIVMATPPMKDGGANPDILAAAAVAGVDKICLMGGAQAVAALAYGTETVERVDKIVGPGNIYVATAKRLLFGEVDIDMIAGPSEILILADESANPKFLAADLMSQAEHDVLASAILLTTSERIAQQTLAELEIQVGSMERRDIIKQSLSDYGAIILCESIEQALAFSEEIAPEHLEVCLENPMEYIGKIDNAGSVFLGSFSPESLGDYYAGPNHVLPTGGTARFFSPLGVDAFLKKSSFIHYNYNALYAAREDITQLALAEGLDAHANSVNVRF